MTLINTDGMTFIGPGSEWFWTAMTGLVLAVTFIAIYRQLRMQAHASAIEQVESFRRDLFAEWASRAIIEVAVALRDNEDPADLPRAAAGRLGQLYETFAILARSGHRDVKLFWQVDPGLAQTMWLWLGPWAQKRRTESGDRTFLENLEWLAGVAAEMERRAGRPPMTLADVAGDLSSVIAWRQGLLQAAQELRTVTLAQPVLVAVTRPAPSE